MTSLVKRMMLDGQFPELLVQMLTAFSFLLVFLVFATAVVRALAASKGKMDHLAALPIADETPEEKGIHHV